MIPGKGSSQRPPISYGMAQPILDEEDYLLYSLRKVSFEDNLKEMMFGFGDSIEPYPETVKLMDDLVKDFMVNLTLRGMDIAKRTKQPFSVDCIRYAVLSNSSYVDRLDDLLDAFSEISKQTRYHVSDASDSLASRKRGSHMGRDSRKRQELDEMDDE